MWSRSSENACLSVDDVQASGNDVTYVVEKTDRAGSSEFTTFSRDGSTILNIESSDVCLFFGTFVCGVGIAFLM